MAVKLPSETGAFYLLHEMIPFLGENFGACVWKMALHFEKNDIAHFPETEPHPALADVSRKVLKLEDKLITENWQIVFCCFCFGLFFSQQRKMVSLLSRNLAIGSLEACNSFFACLLLAVGKEFLCVWKPKRSGPILCELFNFLLKFCKQNQLPWNAVQHAETHRSISLVETSIWPKYEFHPVQRKEFWRRMVRRVSSKQGVDKVSSLLLENGGPLSPVLICTVTLARARLALSIHPRCSVLWSRIIVCRGIILPLSVSLFYGSLAHSTELWSLETLNRNKRAIWALVLQANHLERTNDIYLPLQMNQRGFAGTTAETFLLKIIGAMPLGGAQNSWMAWLGGAKWRRDPAIVSISEKQKWKGYVCQFWVSSVVFRSKRIHLWFVVGACWSQGSVWWWPLSAAAIIIPSQQSVRHLHLRDTVYVRTAINWQKKKKKKNTKKESNMKPSKYFFLHLNQEHVCLEKWKLRQKAPKNSKTLKKMKTTSQHCVHSCRWENGAEATANWRCVICGRQPNQTRLKASPTSVFLSAAGDRLLCMSLATKGYVYCV